MPYDYKAMAYELAGPDSTAEVDAIASMLHGNESIHMHENVGSSKPCNYCWMRAGRAVRAIRQIPTTAAEPATT